MRKKKAAKLKEEQFWANFFHFNVPAHLNEVPQHLQRANFRYYNVDDEGIAWMTEYVMSIYQLDLDETDITNIGIKELTKLDYINEIRLKNCEGVDENCLPDLLKIKGLELLHLGGTSIRAKQILEAGNFSELKMLLIDDEDERYLQDLAISLPKDCKLVVNRQPFYL
jgi:hypothetical protein